MVMVARLERELKESDEVSFPTMSPSSFIVEVVVENKPLARDPEGETIHHNLILKGGYSQVTNVRAGKLLRMNVEASSPEDAKQLVRKLCDDLRIYNPAAHVCQVRVVS
jgi:phosphoribosylformylglycinamidine synthase